MVALAARYDRGVALMKDVARGEGISEKYLGQIIMPLKAAGLVVSQRGTHGGYSLARPPREITVKDVVTAIEGPVAPVPCAAADAIEPERGGRGVDACCPRRETCVTRKVWVALRQDIESSLDSVTLLDLAREAREAARTAADWVI
jgi:Rrf2 family protein